MQSLAAGFRSIRIGRDKAAHYRMWHLHQHAGMRRPDVAPPAPPVPFERALITLGEETGKLDDCLRLLADYFEAEDRMMRRVLRHAAYPMFTALAATFIAPLPLVALNQSGAYVLAVTFGLVMWIAAGGALVNGVTRHYLNKPKYVLGRLLRALTVAVESGAGLERASLLAAEATGNPEVIAHVRRQGARERSTKPLSATFAGCPHVPFTAIAALEVADATGDYAMTLRKLADLTE